MNRNEQPTPVRRTERLVVREFGDETVVYDLSTENVTALDAETAAVWSASDGRSTVADLAGSTGQSEDDVAVALVKLDGAGLLAETGVSRRILLRRVGLVAAGVVALPVIAAAPAWAACSGKVAGVSVTQSACSSTSSIATITLAVTLTNFEPNFPIRIEVTYVDEAGITHTKQLRGTVTITNTTACAGTSTNVTFTAKRNNQGNQSVTVYAVQATTTKSTSISVNSC